MRLFTAIELPEGIKERILEKGEELNAPGITRVNKNAMHLTLHFFGEKSDDEKEKIISSLMSVKWNPFEIEVYGIAAFNPKFIRVIFAGIRNGGTELASLYKELSSKLEESSVSFEKEEYKPHITIARVKYGDKGRLLSFIEKYKDYDFGSFKASSFYLIKSMLTPNGPLYEKLFEFKSQGTF